MAMELSTTTLPGRQSPQAERAPSSSTARIRPPVLGGAAFLPFDKVTTSFVYIGFPFADAGQQFNATVVPEPTGLVLAAIGSGMGLLACAAAGCAVCARYSRLLEGSRKTGVPGNKDG